MERFIKSDIVVIPFPFSDLTGAKRRPALVITNLKGEDLILCKITSKKVRDKYAIVITEEEDFEEGSLRQESNVRPNKIFTADGSIILYKVGRLKREKVEKIIETIVKIIKN